MLQTLHRVMDRGMPVYGMNFGSVGFLMNEFDADDLPARLAAAKPTDIYPLVDARRLRRRRPATMRWRSTRCRCSAPRSRR